MATRQADGSIRMADGRIVYANSLVLAQDLAELVPLFGPPPAWPFVSGGGGGGGGASGPAGSIGAVGNQGGQGPQGNQGNQGAFGPQGNQGNQGLQGTNPGVQGPQGNQGFQGSGGGPQGFQGNQGFQGTNPGPQGNQGFQGNVGPQGNQGFQGTTGPSQIAEDAGPFGLSGAPAVITGMSITPAAGTYLVWYAGTFNQGGGGSNVTVEIFAGGVGVAGSIKNSAVTGASVIAVVDTIARVAVNGAQAIEARASATGVGNTLTNNQLMIARTT